MPLYPIDPLEQDERAHLAAEAQAAPEQTYEERYVRGLRDLADFLDGRHDLINSLTSGVTVYYWAHMDGTNPDTEAVFKEKALSLGDGRTDKVAGSYFNSEIAFGPHRFQVTRPINLDTPKSATPPHPLA